MTSSIAYIAPPLPGLPALPVSITSTIPNYYKSVSPAGVGDYKTLSDGIAALGSGGVLELFTDNYYLTEPVSPSAFTLIKANGSTIYFNSKQYSAFNVSQPNIVISGAIFDGQSSVPSYANTGYYGVRVVKNTYGLAVVQSTFRNINNIGIAAGTDEINAYLQDGYFNFNQFYGGNSAISGALRNSHIIRNYCYNVGIFAIELDGSGAVGYRSWGNDVHKNTFYETGSGAPSGKSPHAIFAYQSSDNDIAGNYVSGTKQSAGIALDASAFRNRIHDNSVLYGDADGIFLRQCDYAILHDNHIYDNGQAGGGYAGIIIDSGNIPVQVKIQDNEIYDDQGSGTNPSGSPTQTYGININTGANADGLEILNNKLYRNITAAINNWQYAALVLGNRGFNPLGFGATTITIHASDTYYVNPNPFPCAVFVTNVGTTVTAYSIEDANGATETFTITIATGYLCELDVGESIAITYDDVNGTAPTLALKGES